MADVAIYNSGPVAPFTHFKPPPTAEEIDRYHQRNLFNEIRRKLQEEADDAFPNDGKSRYSNVYVLLICWADEDPKLPVSFELDELANVFSLNYGFHTETWKIPGDDCHNELSRKILEFIGVGGDSRRDLKIVYYAGHGLLTKGRQLAWANVQNRHDKAFRQVKWGGIQNTLEEARSDVLIILDCCASGTANTDDGQGITELIAACGFNTIANPVGALSFTRALITELRLLSREPSFTVSILYNNILSRIQKWMPELQESMKSPVHVLLTQDRHFPIGIQLSPQQRNSSSLDLSEAYNSTYTSPLPITAEAIRSYTSQGGTAVNSVSDTVTSIPGLVSLIDHDLQAAGLPRLDLNIWLQASMSLKEFPTDSFGDWLRMIPIRAQRVRIGPGPTDICVILRLIQESLIGAIQDEQSLLRNIRNEISLTQTTLNAATSILDQMDEEKKRAEASAEKLEKSVSNGFAAVVEELGKQGSQATKSAEKLNDTMASGFASVMDEVREQGRHVSASAQRIETALMSKLEKDIRVAFNEQLELMSRILKPEYRMAVEVNRPCPLQLAEVGFADSRRGHFGVIEKWLRLTGQSSRRTRRASWKNRFCSLEIRIDEKREGQNTALQYMAGSGHRKRARKSRTAKVSFQFNLPYIFLTRGLSMRYGAFDGMFGGNLQSYNVVPYDSPVFNICRSFDLETIQRLFVEGLASPWDQSYEPDISLAGETLVRLSQVESDEQFDKGFRLLRFLSDEGACQSRVIPPRQMTNLLIVCLKRPWTRKRYVRCMRLILQSSYEDPLCDTGVGCFLTLDNEDDPFFKMLASEEYWPIEWGEVPFDETRAFFGETDRMLLSDPEGWGMDVAISRGRRYLACSPDLIMLDRPPGNQILPIHSLLLQASRTARDDIRITCTSRLSNILRRNPNQKTLGWLPDSSTNSLYEMSPTDYARHLGVLNIWEEALGNAGWTPSEVQGLLDEDQYAGVSELVSDALPSASTDMSRMAFVDKLCDGGFVGLSDRELDNVCRDLRASLGVSAWSIEKTIRSANSAWQRRDIPGSWYDTVGERLVPNVDFELPEDGCDGTRISWSRYVGEDDLDTEEEWFDAMS